MTNLDNSIWTYPEKQKQEQQQRFDSLSDGQKLNYISEAYDALDLFLSKDPALTHVQWALIERVRINLKKLI